MDASALRARFPVLRQLAYLNAGTDGPIPSVAAAAARESIAHQEREGRTVAHFRRRGELQDELRGLYARALDCAAADVALTTSTTDGVATAVTGLPLGPEDEILTSDEEHPGLLGSLAAARRVRGVTLRVAPFERIVEAVSQRTALVACSHVSWMSGSLVSPALREVAAAGVTVLLDGAQGVGAVPVDPAALGCHLYAGPGQKWLCGPDGTGLLYVSADIRERLTATRPGFGSLTDPHDPLQSPLHPDARRFDAPALPAEGLVCALEATRTLTDAGWAGVHERGAGLAARLADELAQRGYEVLPRGRTTLVSWRVADPDAALERLTAAGVVVRTIPAEGVLRASVGAWNDESDLERLLDAL